MNERATWKTGKTIEKNRHGFLHELEKAILLEMEKTAEKAVKIARSVQMLETARKNREKD